MKTRILKEVILEKTYTKYAHLWVDAKDNDSADMQAMDIINNDDIRWSEEQQTLDTVNVTHKSCVVNVYKSIRQFKKHLNKSIKNGVFHMPFYVQIKNSIFTIEDWNTDGTYFEYGNYRTRKRLRVNCYEIYNSIISKRKIINVKVTDVTDMDNNLVYVD